MSLLDVKVELGLQVGGVAGTFILDNDSFGVLGTSTLAGLEFVDVTEYVKNISVVRGRSRQLDHFNAGTCNIVFDNRSRIFDPLNENSVFYPGVLPRNIIKISSGIYPIFYGFVNDWNFDFDITQNDMASISASDSFMILSNQVLTGFTPSVETSGSRINNLLNRSEVDFVGGRDIEVGNSTLGDFAVANETNVLNYMRQVEKSELGSLFISAAGDIVFRDRASSLNDEVVYFADDGSAIPYQTLSNQFGDEILYNYVKAASPAGAEQVISDQGSINKYQISQLVQTDLLNSTTSEVEQIANILLTRYREPKLRFTGLSVQLVGLSEEQKQQILNLDLIKFVEVKKSFSVGSPSSIDQLSFVSGISHRVTPDSHLVTLTLESADLYLFFTLGNFVAGRLDSGILDL
jgi:hypothetical protein